MATDEWAGEASPIWSDALKEIRVGLIISLLL
jgi:hypothetical protein